MKPAKHVEPVSHDLLPSVHSDWLKGGLVAYIMPVKAYKTQFQNAYVIRREADFLSPESITKAKGSEGYHVEPENRSKAELKNRSLQLFLN